MKYDEPGLINIKPEIFCFTVTVSVATPFESISIIIQQLLLENINKQT